MPDKSPIPLPATTTKSQTDSESTSQDSVRAADGKARFVEELYRLCWNDLVGWLRRRYGAGPPDPEDVAQSAFEKITALDNWQSIRDPRAFLFTTAINTALMGVRRIVTRRRYIDEQLKNYGENLDEMSPERIYSSRQRFDIVMREIERLPAKQREIVIRARLQGQTFRQITAETGWNNADISRQLKAALSSIDRILNDAGVADVDENKGRGK